MTRPASFFLAPLLLLLLAGCKQDPKTVLPTVKMRIGAQPFVLEVADTDATRRHGLMRRDSMPADHGMLFVFDHEAPLGFYMKNTRIPLDILYLDAHGKIVSIKQMKPFDLNSTPSDAPAQYAIELNEGAAKKSGAKPGMTLTLPPNLKAKD